MTVLRIPNLPVMDITKADNHPIYVNGTVLVNGMPIIDDDHKDETRLSEFKAAGFSDIYIQWLTDPKYPRSIKGSPCNYGGNTLPYKPSYSRIGNFTELCDPDNLEILHKIEIADNAVLFNGRIIATAPDKHSNGKKFTKTEKTTFLKAVVYTIIPRTIKRLVKNRYGNMVYEDVPDDEYLRELIAKYPAIPITSTNPDVPETMPEISPIIPTVMYHVPVGPIMPGYLPHIRCTIREVPA